MKDYKQALVVAGIAAALASPQVSLAQTNPFEAMNPQSFRVNLGYSMPDADDNWDGGVDFRGQLIFEALESMPDFMLAFSLGYASWDANDDVTTTNIGTATSGQLSGDASIVELGASLLRSKPLQGNFSLLAEAGLAYQVFSSDIDATYNYGAAGNQTSEVDLDNSLLLQFGADIMTPISDKANVFFGAAYQFDLIDGDATAFGDEEKNTAGAFKLRAGVEFNF